MKAELVDLNGKEPEWDGSYPVLMRHTSSETVVLFTALTEGTAVVKGNESLGRHRDAWTEATDGTVWTWVPPNQKVVLSNE